MSPYQKGWKENQEEKVSTAEVIFSGVLIFFIVYHVIPLIVK